MTRERLRQYGDLVREQHRISDRVAELRAMAEAIGAQRISPTSGISASHDGRTMENVMIRLDEMQERYLQTLEQILDERAAIEAAIQTLPPRARQILDLRYVQCLKWEDVCDRIPYEWSQMHKIHRLALRELERLEEPDK